MAVRCVLTMCRLFLEWKWRYPNSMQKVKENGESLHACSMHAGCVGAKCIALRGHDPGIWSHCVYDALG